METGFEEFSTDYLKRFAISLTEKSVERVNGRDVQILARITAELAERVQQLEY